MVLTPAEAKAAADKAAAELKQLNEMIEQLKRDWLNTHGALPAGQNFSVTEELMFKEKAVEKLATEAKQATEAKALADADAAAPLSDAEKALKGSMSKIAASFKGGRFPFVGTALTAAVDFLIKLMPAFKAIIPMIQNVSTMFNPAAAANETPVERVKGLVDAGNLDDANALLQTEDLKLIKDMKTAFESDKDAPAFQASEAKLKECRGGLKTLENDLEKLMPLKDDKADKDELKAHLEIIKADLKQITEHYRELQPLVEAAGNALQSLPIIFQRMKPIIDAHQKLYDQEVAALPKAAAPPAAPH